MGMCEAFFIGNAQGVVCYNIVYYCLLKIIYLRPFETHEMEGTNLYMEVGMCDSNK